MDVGGAVALAQRLGALEQGRRVGDAPGVALQHQVRRFDELGVERALAVLQQGFDRELWLAFEAHGHGLFGVLEDVGVGGADALCVFLAPGHRADQQFGQRSAGAKTQAHGVDRRIDLVEWNRALAQARQQRQQIAGGLEIEVGLVHHLGQTPHFVECLGGAVVLQGQQALHHIGEPLQARTVGLAHAQAVQLLGAAQQAALVVVVQPGEGQQHQRLRVIKLGVQTDAGGPIQQLHPLLAIARVKGHHAVLEQATDRARREPGGHGVGVERVLEIAQLKLRPAHHVVGVGVARIGFDQALQRGRGPCDLARFELDPRHAELGPGQGIGCHHRFVQPLRFVKLPGAQHQLGTDACRVQPVRPALGKTLGAQRARRFKALLLDGGENFLQRQFALAGLRNAREDRAVGGVRLEQVGIERRLCRLGHLGVGGLGGDDDEHGVERQQLVAPQIVEQILTAEVLAVEMLLAQHDVETAELPACCAPRTICSIARRCRRAYLNAS